MGKNPLDDHSITVNDPPLLQVLQLDTGGADDTLHASFSEEYAKGALYLLVLHCTCTPSQLFEIMK